MSAPVRFSPEQFVRVDAVERCIPIEMPIYDYRCQSCDHTFEAFVRGSKVVVCPECKSENLERLMSLPAIKSDGTHAKAMRAATARDQKQGKEREHAQRQYELNHD